MLATAKTSQVILQLEKEMSRVWGLGAFCTLFYALSMICINELFAVRRLVLSLLRISGTRIRQGGYVFRRAFLTLRFCLRAAALSVCS
jgi:hypothetical protein